MKNRLLVWGLGLLLSVAALPGFAPAAQAEGSGALIYDVQAGLLAVLPTAALPDVPIGVPVQLWTQIMGRDSFGVYDAGRLRARLYGTTLPRPAAMPGTLWRMVHTNDGFNAYNADQLRARLYGTSEPKPASMPGQLWREIHTRDSFDVYASGRSAGANTTRRAQPAGMPAALWQMITGRDGFDVR